MGYYCECSKALLCGGLGRDSTLGIDLDLAIGVGAGAGLVGVRDGDKAGGENPNQRTFRLRLASQCTSSDYTQD